MYKCRASPSYEVILRLGQLIVMLPGSVEQILATGHKNIFVAQKLFFSRWKFSGKYWKIIDILHWNPSKIEKFHFFSIFGIFIFLENFRFCKGFQWKNFEQKKLKKKVWQKNIFSIAHNFFASEGILDRTKVLESLARDLFKSARNPLEIDLRKS